MIRKPDSFVACPAGARVFCTAAALAAIWCASFSAAQATPVTFDLVPSASQIDLTASGTLLDGALTVVEQFPNALTRYSGTIETNLTQTSIAFPGGSVATADVLRNNLNNPHQVSPAIGGGTGSAPANYGVTMSAPVGYELPPIEVPNIGEIVIVVNSINVALALRDIVLDVTAPNLPLTPLPSPQSFDSADLSLLITGNADVRLTTQLQADNFLIAAGVEVFLQDLASQQPELGITVSRPNIFSPLINVNFGTTLAIPTTPVDNSLAGLGTLAYVGSAYELTIPVNFQLTPDFGDIGDLFALDLNLQGELFATAEVPEVPPVPEPSSMLLAAMAAGAMGLVAMRRRRG